MKRRKQILSLLLASVMTVSSLAPAAVADAHMSTKPADGVTYGQPFAAGTGGSQNFRIPCLVSLDDGTIVAACDARWTWAADAGGIDTIVSRSTDNGATWNYTFANYMGDNGNVANKNSTCFIDPAIATDGEKLWMIADLYPAGYAINSAAHYATPGVSKDAYGNMLLSADERATYAYHLEKIENGTVESYYKIVENESGNTVPGYTIDAYFNIKGTKASGEAVDTNLFFENSPYEFLPTDYLYLTTSEDGGATWSIPSIIDVRKNEEQSLLVGPGTGMVASTGRIIFTVYDYTNADGHSACIYSDDGGVTWTRGQSVANQTSEATVTEADGRLYMFTRHGGYYVSEDWGETWSERKNLTINSQDGTQLNCITYSKKIDGKTAIIFSAPAGSSRRTDGKLFVALVQEDGSLSWDYEYEVNKGTYAYSSVTELKDGSIGLLYEYQGSGITYENIPIMDIVGYDADINALYCANEEGIPVDTIEMRANQEVTLEVAGMTAMDLQVDSDNDLVTATLDGTTLKIKAADSIEDLAQAQIAISDGVDFITVDVIVMAAENYKMVNVGVGETVTHIDETGNYANADLSKVDESVANVTLIGRDKDVQAGLETNTSGNTGADFAEGTMEVKDCLYTFTKGSADGKYVISATTAEGKTVYLSAEASPKNNYPCLEKDTPIETTVAKITDANSNNEFSLKASGVLYFQNGTQKSFFYDRNGSDVSAGNCWFELYKAAETPEEVTASATSPIPGYVKLTELTDIEDGGKYLIAHKGYDNVYYIMRPSASTSDKYSHVAKVLPETAANKVALTEVTISGVAEGLTCATVGDTSYYINVEEKVVKSTAKKLRLSKDEYMGVVEAVTQPEGNVVKVEANSVAAPYAAVSEISNGKYLIGNASYIVINEASGASTAGLKAQKVDYLQDNLSEKLWTVTQVEGGYTIQDKDGKYIKINGTSVTLSDTEEILTVTSQGDNLYSIGKGNQNLNNYSGANNNIAAYGGVDGNSKWYFYQSTGNVITATHCGTVEMKIGDVDYEVTVEHDCDWEVETEPTCTSRGIKIGTCSMCSEEFMDGIDPLHHTYGEWEIETAATCTTTGLKSKSCTVCQKTEEQVIPKTGDHTYSAWTTVTAATSTTKGLEEKNCTVDGCNVKQQRETAKVAAGEEPSTPDTPGTTVAVTGVTLSHSALTSGWLFMYMDEATETTITAVVAPENATNKKVTFSIEDESVATVSQDGKITAKKAGQTKLTVTTEDGAKTAQCTVYVTTRLIEAISTLRSKINLYKRNTEDLYTADNWTRFSAALDNAQEIHTKAQEDASSVTLKEVTDAYTELEAAATAIGVSEATLQAKVNEVKGIATNRDAYTTSSWNAYASALSAAEEYLAGDGYSVNDGMQKYNALVNAFNALEEKAPSGGNEGGNQGGNEGGNQGGNEGGNQQPTTHEHTYGEVQVTKAPTCTEKGEGTKTCTVADCGHTETVEVVAKGHAYAETFTVDKAATCTEAGSQSKHCANCDATTEVTTIPVIAHTSDTGVITKQPTATAEGEKTYSCTVCKTVIKTEKIAATETGDTTTPGTGDTTKPGDTTTPGTGDTTKPGDTTTPGTGDTTKPEETKKPLAKGKKFTVKNGTYKVTKAAIKGGTVTFVSAKKKSAAITVPATVKYDGVTYNVTSVEKNAFKNQKKATKITIGKNVTKIGATAFANCIKLKNIKIQSAKFTKKSLAKTTFKGVKTSVKISVPKAKLKAYKTLFKKAGLSSKVKVTK